MKEIPFVKYHGTGNDFVLIDNRKNFFQFTKKEIALFCHRRFGIGADGLMLLQNDNKYKFEMIYYNSDGLKSSMCGNGGRCIVAFAHSLGIFKKEVSFIAMGKEYSAHLVNQVEPQENVKNISLKMNDISKSTIIENRKRMFFVIDTGSPHYVKFVDNLDKINFIQEAKKIRYGKMYEKNGINVNFVSITNKNKIAIRTYERGVENETYSCGTGAVAAALAFHLYENNDIKKKIINLKTKGGKLKVSFQSNKLNYQNIFLSGETVKVFEGN